MTFSSSYWEIGQQGRIKLYFRSHLGGDDLADAAGAWTTSKESKWRPLPERAGKETTGVMDNNAYRGKNVPFLSSAVIHNSNEGVVKEC